MDNNIKCSIEEIFHEKILDMSTLKHVIDKKLRLHWVYNHVGAKTQNRTTPDREICIRQCINVYNFILMRQRLIHFKYNYSFT